MTLYDPSFGTFSQMTSHFMLTVIVDSIKLKKLIALPFSLFPRKAIYSVHVTSLFLIPLFTTIVPYANSLNPDEALTFSSHNIFTNLEQH